jgi:hypothetical protein
MAKKPGEGYESEKGMAHFHGRVANGGGAYMNVASDEGPVKQIYSDRNQNGVSSKLETSEYFRLSEVAWKEVSLCNYQTLWLVEYGTGYVDLRTFLADIDSISVEVSDSFKPARKARTVSISPVSL